MTIRQINIVKVVTIFSKLPKKHTNIRQISKLKGFIETNLNILFHLKCHVFCGFDETLVNNSYQH